jgi:hypothetical protein
MQPAANVTSGDAVDWHAIDWKRVYRIVKNLRPRIFRASRNGDLTRVIPFLLNYHALSYRMYRKKAMYQLL